MNEKDVSETEVYESLDKMFKEMVDIICKRDGLVAIHSINDQMSLRSGFRVYWHKDNITMEVIDKNFLINNYYIYAEEKAKNIKINFHDPSLPISILSFCREKLSRGERFYSGNLSFF